MALSLQQRCSLGQHRDPRHCIVPRVQQYCCRHHSRPTPHKAVPDKLNSPVAAPSTISPASLLHRLEFAAIAVAAVGQAALLVSTAFCQWRQTQQLADLQDQLHSFQEGGSIPEAHAASSAHRPGTDDQQQQQALVHVQYHPAAAAAAPVAAASGLHLITSSALVVGLLCGAGLRQLQLRHTPQQSTLRPSADAAVRLAALEVASQQTSAQLSATAKQMDKLQARVRLATSDLKQPIRAAQGAAAQQAASLLKLSEQQLLLQKQVDGSQELIAALQGLAAKQFVVSAEALQQLKQGQAQLSASTSKALKQLQQQQSAVQEQLQAQQQQLRRVEQQAAAMQRQHAELLHMGPAASSYQNGSSGGSNGKAGNSTPPDPWVHQSAAAAVAHPAADAATTAGAEAAAAEVAGDATSDASASGDGSMTGTSISSSASQASSNGSGPNGVELNGADSHKLNGTHSPAAHTAS